jgi:hypothetical protein
MTMVERDLTSSHRRKTITRHRWPSSPEYTALAQNWAVEMSAAMIALIWEAVELLTAEVTTVQYDEIPEQLERGLGFLLSTRISRVIDRALPFVAVHEPPELERIATARARPPQPDLGFVMNGNDRVIWPVEMKVLKNDRDVSEYAKEVNANFLTCKYAALTAEGAMLAYLLRGDPEVAYQMIADAIPCTLLPGWTDPPRNHRISEHQRAVPVDEDYSPKLRCHHLIAVVSLHGDSE